ncbi:MAG: hypothetical protein ACXVPC_07570, partial [Tumebacillaceae bacterium]
MNSVTKTILASLVCSMCFVGCGVTQESQAPQSSTQTSTPAQKSIVQQATASLPESNVKKSESNSPVEGTYPIVSSHGMFIQVGSLAELYQKADIIAEIQVVDQDIVPIDDLGLVSTRSTVDVKKTFKGDSALTSLRITESGGLVDLSKLPKLDKPGKGHEPANPGIVDTAVEGSPVMKKGQTYLVFISKNSNPKWGYNIVGAVQGKLKIDGASGKVINTIDPAYANENMYFLQKQFVGKA